MLELDYWELSYLEVVKHGMQYFKLVCDTLML